MNTSSSKILGDNTFTNVLKKYGYHTLNDIQVDAFKYIINCRDVLIIAPTGYGKTEAALFPILWSLHNDKKGFQSSGIKALYITPLRALNRDIFRRMESLSKDLGIDIELRHGDTPTYRRRQIIVSPPDILITTPETLQFLLVGKRVRKLLETVKWVVIDEIHELLGSKRGTQLAIALERLDKISKNRIVRIALSATIGNENIAARYFTRGKMMYIVKCDEKKKMEIDVVYPYKKDTNISEKEKLETRLNIVLELIEKYGNTIVFTNTRDTAELLATRLRLVTPFEIRVHHGSLSREERIEVERDFKRGCLKAVIATSSLELGIDIGLINLVIQYMSPRQVNRLLQRVGRSGHFRTKASKGIIVTSDIYDYLESVVIAMRALRGNLDDITPIFNALDVLAHQIVGIALEYRRISLQDLYNLIIRAYPYKHLSFSKFYELILFMDKIKLIKLYGDKVGVGSRSFEYYFTTSMIPDVDSFSVITVSTNRKIGSIDSDFVMSSLNEGEYFILGGNVWNVIKIDVEKKIVYVREGRLKYGILPAWIGEDLPVSYKVAREVCALCKRIFMSLVDKNYDRILRDYKIMSLKKMIPFLFDYFSKFREGINIMTGNNILIEVSKKIVVINVCLGSRGNEALGLLITYLLSNLYGYNIVYRVDPYHVVLSSSRRITPQMLDNVFNFIVNNSFHEELVKAIKRTNIFKWKFLQVAKRLGLVSKSESKYILSNIYRYFSGTPAEEEALNETIISRFDLKALNLFVKMLKDKKVRLVYRLVNKGEWSILSEEVFKKFYKSGFLVDNLPLTMIARVVENRLLNTRVRLICLHCARWSSTYKVKDVNIDRCPVCGSRALAVYNIWDDPLSIIKKWKSRNKLTKEERELIKRLQKSAIVFLNYGRKGVMVLAGRGIGPHTALKILREAKYNEELIYKIVKYENNYLRTREYWG